MRPLKGIGSYGYVGWKGNDYPNGYSVRRFTSGCLTPIRSIRLKTLPMSPGRVPLTSNGRRDELRKELHHEALSFRRSRQAQRAINPVRP